MTATSSFLLPSATLAEARSAFSEPIDVVNEVRRRLAANRQRNDRAAVSSYVHAAMVVASRARDRTGLGYSDREEEDFSLILRLAETDGTGEYR